VDAEIKVVRFDTMTVHYLALFFPSHILMPIPYATLIRMYMHDGQQTAMVFAFFQQQLPCSTISQTRTQATPKARKAHIVRI
jgi:hypothetical protein